MTFDDLAKTLSALRQTVSDLGGDSSAIAATEAMLRSSSKRKPADFIAAGKKAVKDGLRLPRATEVRASDAAEAVDALHSLLKASGANARSLKVVSDLRTFFRSNAGVSLEALTEALKKPAPKSSKPKATANRSTAKPAAAKRKPAAKTTARPAPKAAAKQAAKPASRSAAKTATKTVAKRAAKPATKPAAKPAAKPVAKIAAESAAKTASKTASKPVASPTKSTRR